MKLLLLILRSSYFLLSCIAYTYNWEGSDTPLLQWSSITSDSSGKYLFAVGSSIPPLLGGVFHSSDFGHTWINVTSVPTGDWTSVTSNSTGGFVSAVFQTGDIYTSNDYGASWNITTPSGVQMYFVTCDGSGAILFAAGSNNGGIYKSSSAGINWVITTAPSLNWVAITTDSTGTYVAACNFGSYVYISSNGGATWTETTQNADSYAGYITSDKNTGQILIVASQSGNVFYSNDFGSTWGTSTAPSGDWFSLAADSTGQYVIGALNNNGVYTSTNYGQTFTRQSYFPKGYWYAVACDGTCSSAYVGGYNKSVYLGNVAPTSFPTSQPSLQPSVQPTGFPTIGNTNFLLSPVTVEATTTSTSYKFTNLGSKSSVFLTVELSIAYITETSGAYINITAGTGASQILVGENCVPTVACSSTAALYCALNVDVASAISSEDGGSMIVSSDVVNVGNIIGYNTECTYQSTPVYYILYYTLSGQAQPTLTPTRVPSLIAPPTSSNSNNDDDASDLSVVNQDGAPFYVIAIVTAVFCGIGFLVLHVRDQYKQLSALPFYSSLFHCTVTGYCLITEVFYLLFLFTNQNPLFTTFGVIILLMRLISCLLTIGYLSVFFNLSSYLQTSSQRYQNQLDRIVLAKHSSEFSLVIIIAFFDHTFFKFFPWCQTDLCDLSGGYSDIYIFLISNSIKLMQITVITIIQCIVLGSILYDSDPSSVQLTVIIFIVLYFSACFLSLGLLFFPLLFRGHLIYQNFAKYASSNEQKTGIPGSFMDRNLSTDLQHELVIQSSLSAPSAAIMPSSGVKKASDSRMDDEIIVNPINSTKEEKSTDHEV